VDAILHHRSAPQSPADRGRELGRALEDRIVATADFYRRLVALRAGTCGTDMTRLGGQAMESIGAWAPALADEIEGIAAGCGLQTEVVAALNARTELLASSGHPAAECSTAACTAAAAADGSAIAAQTWDWLADIGPLWFVWTIEHEDGRVVHTLTEPGIVGKIGVSTGGVAVLLNILKHARDGAPIGTPVHVVCRRVLDETASVGEAVALVESASPSASSCMTVVDAETALAVEYWRLGPGFVPPDERGLLAHTNHFVSDPAREGDLEPGRYPDTLERLAGVRDALDTLEPGLVTDATLLDVLAAHGCGGDRVCVHTDSGAAFGEDWQTLATVVAEPARGRLQVHRGGPRHLDEAARWHSAADGKIAASADASRSSSSGVV
jgi:isopenicillin-N N-acyltransferase-like protein